MAWLYNIDRVHRRLKLYAAATEITVWTGTFVPTLQESVQPLPDWRNSSGQEGQFGAVQIRSNMYVYVVAGIAQSV